MGGLTSPLSSFSDNILQFDGNVSISDMSESSYVSCFPNNESKGTIPVILNNRPVKPRHEPRTSVIKTLKRNNKILNAVTLPKVACYNMRSLMPKIKMLAADIKDRSCSLALLSEIWEKADNKKHQMKIEELYEMEGLKYLSNPRPGIKRGG